jgi:hypothetical protein
VDLDVDVRLILKGFLRKEIVRVWSGSGHLRIGPVVDRHGQNSSTSGCAEGAEFIDKQKASAV